VTYYQGLTLYERSPFSLRTESVRNGAYKRKANGALLCYSAF
jgi:hypothetical protein